MTTRSPCRTLSDRGVLLLAATVTAGAWAALPFPWALGAVLAVGARVARRPMLFVVATGLLASGLAAHATEGLRVLGGRWTGTVEVVRVIGDPGGTLRYEVRAGGHHLLLAPAGAGRAGRRTIRPGDRFAARGRIAPADPVAERNRGRHVAGFLRASTIGPNQTPAWYWRGAHLVRDAVGRLGRPLPPGERALFDGFVLGDPAGQSALQRADFSGSGLTHLLVASGENVALVLTLAGPLLRRLRLGWRWAVTIALLLGFALATGFEPSVLRAAVMAAVVATGVGMGRPVPAWRNLGLSITALLIADPFLVHSLAFGLSVGASAGIVALARPISELLPGPHGLRSALAVTAAAQVGVAPLLVGLPGGLPVATLPANVLVAEIAALVVVVGAPCLAIAASGFPVAGIVSWVPRSLLAWIDLVARRMAALPLGTLGPIEVVVAVVALAVALAARRADRRWLLRSAGVVAIFSCCWPALHAMNGPSTGRPVDGFVVLRRGSTTVVVLTGTVPAEQLLTGVSVAALDRVDVVVVPRGDRADAASLHVLAHRCSIGRVLTPRPMQALPWTVTVARRGRRLIVGTAVIDVVLDRPMLSVRVEPSGARGDPG